MTDIAKKAEALEREAIGILNRTFLNLPEGVGSNGSVRLVECLVGAAICHVAALQSLAVQQGSASEVQK